MVARAAVLGAGEEERMTYNDLSPEMMAELVELMLRAERHEAEEWRRIAREAVEAMRRLP